MILLTQSGEDWIADILIGQFATGTHYLRWGTGAGVAGKGDFDVFGPGSETVSVATRSQPVSNTLRWSGSLIADGSKTITNVGVLALTPGFVLVMHGDHPGIALAAGDGIQYAIDLVLTAVEEDSAFIAIDGVVIPGG
jgi:hypothetical protein